jgi:hypothetical protein
VGGGTDVGVYRLTVRYSTDSDNYLAPSDVTVYLEVLPLEVEVDWLGSSFVYSGGINIPSASFKNVFGASIALSVTGGGVNSGEYTAKAICNDKNYCLTNTTFQFIVSKADYDLSTVKWLQNGMVYDGKELKLVSWNNAGDDYGNNEWSLR